MANLDRLGLVVGRNETWSFIRSQFLDLQNTIIIDEFKEQATRSPIFRERLNQRILKQSLSNFLASHEVVLFEWASEYLSLASTLPKHARIITRLHRYEMYEWIDRVNWNVVDGIIFASEAKRTEFLARFPGRELICHVIPPSVNLMLFSFRPKQFRGNLGILCHLTPRKRVYELILAFYELTLRQAGLHLYIGGGSHPAFGDYYLALNDLVQRLNLQEYVTFDGVVTDSVSWYEKIDIFISNSYSEGLQLSSIEAMASGCYVLSHWWAGANELLPVDNLYLTDAELQQRLLAYIALPEGQKKTQVESLRRIVETRFDVRLTAPLIRALIEGERSHR